MEGNFFSARSQARPLLPTPNPTFTHLFTCSISPLCWDLLCQGEGARGGEATGMSQVTGGTTGAAVHLVFTARSLRDGPDSVFAPQLAPAAPLPPLSSQTCTWGMGQHPQEPSSIMQHVEELGHSNWLPGHWTAPTGLVSVDKMTQDATDPVSDGSASITPGAAGTRATLPAAGV